MIIIYKGRNNYLSDTNITLHTAKNYLNNYYQNNYLNGGVATLFLNSECNFKCIFCRDWLFARKSALSKNEWMRALEEIASLGIQKVVFTGGEPLLFPYIYSLIKHANDLGLLTELVTNGYLVNDRLQNIIDANLGKIKISLYDHGSGHTSRIVQVDNASDQIISGIRAIKEFSATKVCIRHMVIKQNILDVSDFIIFAFNELNVDELDLYPIAVRINNTTKKQKQLEHLGYSSLYPTYSQIALFNKQIVPSIKLWITLNDLIADSFLIFGENKKEIHNYLRSFRASDIKDKRTLCFQAFYNIYLHDDGSVLACNSVKHHKNIIGNYRSDSLEKILFSSLAQDVKKQALNRTFSACKNCKKELMKENECLYKLFTSECS